MQVNVINTSSLDSFDYLLFPDQNPNNQYFIQQQLTRFSDTLTDAGKKFLETTKAIYEKINDSNAVRAAKAAVRMAKGIFHPNSIIYLDNLDYIRTAQPVMQRFIMAEPTIRQYYHEQKCDGFADTYVDIHPGQIGDQHYDYRRVMDAIIQDSTDEEGNYEWVSKNYLEDLITGDRELHFEEKIDILKTWDVMKMFISQGEDPTNIFGGKL
jgi:predicted transcriptional regulator